MEKITYISENVAYDASNESIVVLNEPKPKHTSVYEDKFVWDYENNLISFWGRANTKPNDIIKKVQQSTIFLPTVEDISQIIMSGKLGLYLDGQDEALPFKSYPDSQKLFHKATQMNNFTFDFFFHLKLFSIVFVEFILDKKGENIVSAKVLPSQYCRFGKQDENGFVKSVFYSKSWHLLHYLQNNDKIKTLVEIPLQERNTIPKAKKYVVPYAINPLGTLYPTASWEGVLEGWLDVSIDIPKLKKALLDNAIFPKFMIKVSQDYWKERYPDYNEKPELKKQRREKVFSEIQERLTGAENAGKSIGTTTVYDQVNQRTISFLEIVAIENGKLNDNYFTETGEVANYHIYSALRMPSALIGNSLSNGLRVGGDVGEHFNLFWQKTSFERSLFVELMNYVLEVNRQNGEYRFDSVFMRTLSQTSQKQRDLNQPLTQHDA